MKRALAVLAPLALALILPAAAGAEITELTGNACLAKKLKKAASSAAARTRCYAKTAKRGKPAEPCLEQKSRSFEGVFAKLEAKGGCLTTDDGAYFETDLDDVADQLHAALGSTGPSRCDAAKLKCAEKLLKKTLACYAKAAKRGGPVDGACLAKHAAKFEACHAKALGRGDCGAEDDAATAAAPVGDFVERSVCALDGDAPGCSIPDDPEVFLLTDSLRLSGVVTDGFNPVDATLDFRLVFTSFGDDPEDFVVRVNGVALDPNTFTFAPRSIRVPGALVDGRNDVAFEGIDRAGRPLYLEETLWAGSSTVTVELVNASGGSFGKTTTVRATLVDDEAIVVSRTARGGSALFENVPARTVLAEATTASSEFGAASFFGGDSSAQIVMLGFEAPSDIDNDDFSLGTDGWDVGDSPVSIVPHVEGTLGTGGALVPRGTPLPDQDLVIMTSGEGEQPIRRTFMSRPGTTAVRVRYRFVTSEVPGGFHGSEFNDTFRVALRSAQGGGRVEDARGMNSFPLSAFDASGATAWLELTLQPVRPEGDTIQLDAAVANVGDALFDSQLVIDFVEQRTDQVQPALAWNPTLGGADLTFRVVGGALDQQATIEVHWASGPAYANRIGSPILSHVVPAMTAEGSHGPVRIAGNLLAADPAGATHLLASVSPTSVGPLPDVSIGYGPHANAGVVSAGMLNILKDGLRAAGKATGRITSTLRNPADQARAMWNNLVATSSPPLTEAQVRANITEQYGLYAAPGDAVVGVFEGWVNVVPSIGSLLAERDTIRAAMEAEIVARGPSNVSRHCGDPAVRSVIDLSASTFTTQQGALFVGSVQPAASLFIDERSRNGCYHVELD